MSECSPIVDTSERYLDLMKLALTRSISRETFRTLSPVRGTARYWPYVWLKRLFAMRGLDLVHRVRFSEETQRYHRVDRPGDAIGAPPEAETMIGLAGLNQLHEAVRTICAEQIQGDLIECGVWRGGACIFLRACLEVYDTQQRSVWLADSFQGLPKVDTRRYPADAAYGNTGLWQEGLILAIPEAEVRANLAHYGVLDNRVRILAGWFRDTLATAPIERLALLRLDGDLYESTIQALIALYPKVSEGGYIVIDDYRLEGCRAAITDFRAEAGITAPILAYGEGYPHYWRVS